MNIKCYIGPMSKNIVDAIIDFVNSTNNNMGFIPSRRQIDYDGGYVNDWNTKTFTDYIESKSNSIMIQRDHGGPNQGNTEDSGLKSFNEDCYCFNIIHIDPWKICKTIDEGYRLTAKYIRYCHSINPFIRYEIGTEQSIFPYSHTDLRYIILNLKTLLSPIEYNRIIYAVIQSGTSLKENINTGIYNQEQLKNMVSVCKECGILSKEHNGDYLPIELIKEKFDVGLDAINIAPEFGQIETKTYLSEIKELKLFDTYFDICYNSKKWVKWVDSGFDPQKNKEKLINICGHYVLSDPMFLREVKAKIRPDIDTIIKNNVTVALKKLYDIIH